MEELLRDADEFQEILSRSYGVPDELDEADLEAELDALTDELLEQEVGEDTSYLDAISSPLDTLPAPQQPMVGAIFFEDILDFVGFFPVYMHMYPYLFFSISSCLDTKSVNGKSSFITSS